MILRTSAQAGKTPLWGRFSFGERVVYAVALLLLGVSWLAPLHFPPWVSWHGEVVVFLAIFMVSSLAVVRQGAVNRISLPDAVLLFIGLALLVFAQWAAGLITFGGDALVLILYLALCAMCWMLGFSGGLTDRSRILDALAWVLIAASLLSAMVALVQVLEVWESAQWVVRMPQLRRPGANLGQPNQLGTLLLMGLAGAVYLYETRKISAPCLLPIFVVLAIGLATTESRTAVLSYLALTAWWLVGRVRAGFRLPWPAVVVAATAFLALFWFWPMLMSSESSFGTNAVVNTRAGLRLVVWPQLLQAVAAEPWVGWGLREVSEAHNAVAHANLISEPYTYAHNLLLDLAIGLGVPLTALLVVAATVWIWRRVHAVTSVQFWYCVAAVLPVAVHAMLEFPHAYAYFLAPTMIFLGVLDGARTGKLRYHVPRWLVASSLVPLCVLGGWTVVEYLQIEEDFRIVRFQDLRVGQTPSDYKRPQIRLLTQLDALLEVGRINPAPGMAREEIDLAHKVALRFPWPATQKRYALSLALHGEQAEARRQMLVIRALHGEKTYQGLKTEWATLALQKYPQLSTVGLP